jgi:IclR family transcriptional regulator, KDG regulon repressor
MVLKESKKYFVPAAAKTLKILETLAYNGKPLTLQYLTEYTGLPKSSVFSILTTLETLGYIERDTANRFQLTLKVVQFGAAATHSSNLPQLFHQAAQKIVKECGETVQLAILDQTDVIYIGREDGTQQVQLFSQIGRRLPAHATGLGKAMLATFSENTINKLYDSKQFSSFTVNTITSLEQLRAELRLSRERGYAIDNQELALGLQCIAAPIYDHTNQAIAAISVSYLSARASQEHYQCLLKLVLSAAKEISERMGGHLPAYKFSSYSTSHFIQQLTDEPHIGE